LTLIINLQDGFHMAPAQKTVCVVALAVLLSILAARATPGADVRRPALRFLGCVGWGLCVFEAAGGAAANPAVQSVAPLRVRLRGVGDSALEGVCRPEREAALEIRRFVEGILARAGRIELEGVEPRRDGTVLATVLVDGTDVADILVHMGLGREKPLPPGAAWCD
jgi:hypothetical protein